MFCGWNFPSAEFPCRWVAASQWMARGSLGSPVDRALAGRSCCSRSSMRRGRISVPTHFDRRVRIALVNFFPWLAQAGRAASASCPEPSGDRHRQLLARGQTTGRSILAPPSHCKVHDTYDGKQNRVRISRIGHPQSTSQPAEFYDVRLRFIDASPVILPAVAGATGADPGEKGARKGEGGALWASTLRL